MADCFKSAFEAACGEFTISLSREDGKGDYVGASAAELIGNRESAGNYRQVVLIDGKFETIGDR